jgi:hypothetical protein
MATVTSVNSLKIAIALAERQVARDQSQVQSDASRLEQSRAQLEADSRELSNVKQQDKAALATTSTPAPPTLDRAVQTQAGKTLEAPRPQLNAQGETIGKLINISV